MPQNDHNVDVAIIGAGPAGLTAAYLLTKRGYSVSVIEKDAVYVGGISRTVELDGFRFDIGGHRFFSKSKEVVDLWNEILPNDFIVRPRMSRSSALRTASSDSTSRAEVASSSRRMGASLRKARAMAMR